MTLTFSSLLFFGILAPTLLRSSVGIILLYIGIKTLTINKKTLIKFFTKETYPYPKILLLLLGGIEILFGSFLFMGFFTQISSLVVIYICINLIILRKSENKFSIADTTGLILMIIISFTLIFTGAGPFGIDLPF